MTRYLASSSYLGVTRPLTASKIAAMKPGEEAGDGGSGLRIRVSPTGSVRSFRWSMRSPEGKQRWVTLGPWAASKTPGHLTLAEARDTLERFKIAERAGTLETAERDLRKRLEPLVAGLTVKSVAADFLKTLDRKRPEQAERPIEKDILRFIGDRTIASITPQDCRAIVEDVVARGSPTQAGIVLQVMKQLFAFAVDRADIDVNPAERFRNPRALGVVKGISQRVLSTGEIRAFWRALDAYHGLTPTVRSGLKLLLLTGVRSGELLKAQLDHVDFAKAEWTIPVAHQKLSRENERTARPWIVPLPPTALELFTILAAIAKGLGSSHVMASLHAAGPGAPLTEKALNHAMRRLFEGEDPLLIFTGERPTPHDLRRTLRTGLGELGVQFHVAERCLNHSLGKIAQTYDVGDYLPERRAALEKWDAHVQRLVT